jgi:chromosome partitioning protein
MKILVLANQKGGVGKSAIGCQLAYFLNLLLKLRILYLDLDHQKNSTKSLMASGKVAVASFTTSQLLAGQGSDLPDGDFVLVAGDDELSTLERQPEKHNDYVNALKQFLEKHADRFDICIIDTNPNPDIRYAAALVNGDFVLSPIQLNQEAIDGIGSLLTHKRYGYRKIKQVVNPKLELIGILPNLVEGTPFQKGNFEQLVASFSQLLIPMVAKGKKTFAFIPTRTAIAEAQAAGVPLWQLRQAVPEDQKGTTDPASMPVRTSARDAWREIKPAFEEITKRMGIEV